MQVPTVIAQPVATEQQVRDFNIDESTLANAARQFTQQSGVQVSIAAEGASAVRVNGLSGRYSANEAFDRLVAGAGLSWHWEGSGRIVVSGMVVSSEESGRTIGAVRIQGADGTYAGGVPVDGFGRGAGANGSTDVSATENTGSLATPITSVATKRPQRFNEVPQTVSSISQTQIRQQEISDVAGALNSVPGITLQYGAGQSATFISRGFTVNNIVIDGGAAISYTGGNPAGGGVGRPFTPTPDLSQYDHVEVLKGSNALFGGAGEPGGTISLQRKRPLDHNQIVLAGHVGSWNDFRGDIDATGPLTESGHTRARFTLAYQNRDFYYDLANSQMIHTYAIFEQDIGPDTIVRAGGSYEWRKGTGVNYSGLPRLFDGRDLGVARSTNYSAPWAESDGVDDEQFAQLEQRFTDDWKLNLSGTRTDSRNSGFIPNFQGQGITPAGDNLSLAQIYVANIRTEQYAFDGNVVGQFKMFGLDQTLVFGTDYKRLNQKFDQFSTNPFTPFNAYDFDPNAVVQPGRLTEGNAASTILSDTRTSEWGIYGSLTLQPVEGLRLTGGGRFTDYKAETNGLSIRRIGSFVRRSETASSLEYEDVFVPFGSISYDIDKTLSVYASYADTFQPIGAFVTIDGDLLPPRRGRTIEGGVKYTDAEGTLTASASIFDIIQRNVALFASSGTNPIGACCYVSGAAVHNQGAELSVSGQIKPGWEVNAGYTYLKTDYNDVYRQFIEDNTLQTPITLTQQPEHQAKVWTSYTFQGALSGFQIVGGLRYESRRLTIGNRCSILTDETVCSGVEPFRFAQNAYAVADVGVAYLFDEGTEVRLNVTNLTDKRYYATTGSLTSGNFFGEPRKVILAFTATY